MLNNLLCHHDECAPLDVQFDGEKWTKMPPFRYTMSQINTRLQKLPEGWAKGKAERLMNTYTLAVYKNNDCTQSSRKLRIYNMYGMLSSILLQSDML